MHLRQRLLLILLVIVSVLGAQTDSIPTFPQGFTGTWSGTLEIFSPKGLAQTVLTLLHSGWQ